MSILRLQNELRDINRNQNKYFAVSPSNNFLTWYATILGPENTPYNNHEYHLIIEIPQNYPFKPPIIRFAQPCYHPNVSTTGEICLDILTNKKWSPLQNITSILLSIISFLSDPNTSSPLNACAATSYDNDLVQYHSLVQRVYQKGTNKSYTNFPILHILNN